MPPGTGTRGPGMCTKAGARHGAWHQVEKKRNYFAVPGAPFLVRNRSSQSEASTTGTRPGAANSWLCQWFDDTISELKLSSKCKQSSLVVWYWHALFFCHPIILLLNCIFFSGSNILIWYIIIYKVLLLLKNAVAMTSKVHLGREFTSYIYDEFRWRHLSY